MSYLKDFLSKISSRDYPSLLKLWEEYAMSDEVDPKELKQILIHIKQSEFAEPFGKYVEKILPLWENLADSNEKHEIFKLIIDLQTTNQEKLLERVLSYLKQRYPDAKNMQDKIRLTGLRGKEKFQGAIAHFELLNHMMKGKFVFHTGGWGVGEIIDVSMVREELSIEFEHVSGQKHLSFVNGFKNLIPIPDDHFLALRFGKPDALEQKAKDHPLEVIRMVLRDLGPKTAAELKDELCALVIPEEEWNKWWQNTRTKIKKDTMIESPEDLREPFILRLTELLHEDRLRKILEAKPDIHSSIHAIHSFSRDFPEALKDPEFKSFLSSKIGECLKTPHLKDEERLQLTFFLEDLGIDTSSESSLMILQKFKSIEPLLNSIEILAFKKRILTALRKTASWKELFLALLMRADQSSIRDYIFSELDRPENRKDLTYVLEDLLAESFRHPDAFVWYFQKVMSKADVPFSDKEGRIRFFEAFFVVLHHIENLPTEKDLVKKLHGLLTAGRYAIVREIMKNTTLENAKEILLLATKCHSLADHEIKILHSLAEVIHPSLSKLRKSQETGERDEENILWTTDAGLKKAKARVEELATVVAVKTAEEIQIARSHGDLRENAEFKAALEKRNRNQSELKTLADQLNLCRVITKADIPKNEVGIGSVVHCKNKSGKVLHYTLLGPWDADLDQGILSFQSKLAQTMKGLSVGDKFQFQGEEFTITSIKSYLEK